VFLLILGLCGIAVSVCLTWVGVTVVGVVAAPIYFGAMLWSGMSPLAALFYALAGFGALQLGYVVAGVLSAAWRAHRLRNGRVAHAREIGAASLRRLLDEATRAPTHADRAPPLAGSQAATGPVLGGWLPLIACFRPPCHADGAPWDGVEDPGYRVRLLVIGWLGYGVSIMIGSPRLVAPASTRLVGGAVADFDERLAQARARGVANAAHAAEPPPQASAFEAKREEDDPPASTR
jgi:hypothetical protein